ncbi:MAG: hypothetical protein M0R28_23140 [Pigmentiphaga sp.]|nr:hypothetical protein [Pigmentiphaga sp.]
MANIAGEPTFQPHVRQLETTDPKHPDTWNPNYQVLINNDVYLKGEVETVFDQLGRMDERVDTIEVDSAAALSRAIRLDWLYSSYRIAIELFLESWTLLDTEQVAVVATVAGDESVDVVDTATLVAGEEYVIFDGENSETLVIAEILTGQRFRASGILAHTFGEGAVIARTNWLVDHGRAIAGDGGVYFSQPLNLGIAPGPRAVVLRRADTDLEITVAFKDATHTEWTDVPWSWRREVAPDVIDVEYYVPASGEFRLKITSAHGESETDLTIHNFVGVTEPTNLGGVHNGPFQPVNAAPEDAATGLPETPTLAIAGYSSPGNSPQQAIEFQLIEAAGSFAAPLEESGSLPAGNAWSVPPAVLTEGGSYRWRARVQDAEGEWSPWSVDTGFTAAASFEYVRAPQNTSPANGATDIAAQPTLYTSEFEVHGGGEEDHVATQWQIRRATGSYSNPVWDSGEDAVNLVEVVVPTEVLQDGETAYFWRARHKGADSGFSEWSAETRFTTKELFAVIIGISLVNSGGGAGVWARVDEDGNNRAVDASYFNNHPVFAGVTDVTIDGQAMVLVPAFYFRVADAPPGSDRAGRRCWWISDQPLPGFERHPAFFDAGQPIPHFYVGKYQGTADGGTKLGSAAGVNPLVSLDFPTMKARAAARNTGGVEGFSLWSIYQLSAIQMLALIEMGGADSQALIGQGRVNESSAANTNAADVAQATWRGIVGLWGNVWQMVDGLRQNSGGTLEVWDRLGQRNFVSTGITPPSSGWMVSVNHASGGGWDLRDMFVAQTVDGTQGNGTFADYFYRNTGERVAYHGGHWGNGSYAGLFYLRLDHAPSHSNTAVGARLAKV